MRIYGIGITLAAIAAASALSGSCVFDTRTTLCEQFDLRCQEGYQCAASEATCIPIGGCGDGIVDRNKGEVCDDGNTSDGEMVNEVLVPDKCNHDCTSTQECGNGIKDAGEECDHGLQNGTEADSCESNCKFRSKVCGNKTVDRDVGEQCDSGDQDASDCNSKNADLIVPGTGCKIPKCGDGYTNTVALEQCDSFGRITSACNGPLCTTPFCGDNFTNQAAGEDCDAGPTDTMGCNGNNQGMPNPANCKLPSCGDGYVNMAISEACDNPGGSDTPTCNGNSNGSAGQPNNDAAKCQFSQCGDGYTNQAAHEKCDNLDGIDTEACNGNSDGPMDHPNDPAAKCQIPRCGDGYTNTNVTPKGSHFKEQCDTGVDSATCNGNSDGTTAHPNNPDAKCQPVSCGDGYTNHGAGEDCDHFGGADKADCNGNTAGDVRCHTPSCGDGYKNSEAGEECDHLGGGDTVDCNGAAAGPLLGCQLSSCGDGYKNTAAGEQCDVLGGDDTSMCNGRNAGPVRCKVPTCGDGYYNSKAEDCEPNVKDCGNNKQCDIDTCKCTT